MALMSDYGALTSLRSAKGVTGTVILPQGIYDMLPLEATHDEVVILTTMDISENPIFSNMSCGPKSLTWL